MTEPAHGLFGLGVFGSGIDLPALDEDTAWRLGQFIQQITAWGPTKSRSNTMSGSTANAALWQTADVTIRETRA